MICAPDARILSAREQPSGDLLRGTGDPARPELWAQLDEYLRKGFAYEGGGQMVIRAACVD